MIIINRNLCWMEALIVCFFAYLLLGIEAISTENCEPESQLDVKNRDEVWPLFPLQDDPRLKTSYILKAHKILRNGLQQFLGFVAKDLGFYLNHIITEKRPIFKDEYGQVIRSYNKVFKFVWVQYNETLCKNYAINQFENDKLDFCSVARFLSHQPSVNGRETIMKRMGNALGYKCHPCTPYKRKEHGENIAPNTDDISPEGVSPKESLLLCKEYDHHGQQVMTSSTAPPTTTPASTTKLTITSITTITARPTTTATSLFTTTPTTIHLFEAASAAVSGKCAPGSLLIDTRNRDDVKPTFPIQEDTRVKTFNILTAHQILRNGLQQFLEFKEADLETYLKYIVVVKNTTFKDEYGQDIRSYHKMFKFIWVQYNETLCQNYAIKQYDEDKLELCSVARFLSHQTKVEERGTIMKRMGDALGYKCHPCTPYKTKEHGGTVVPNTEDISPIEGLSPEQIFLLCKDYDHHGQKIMVVSAAPEISATDGPRPILSPLDFTSCSYSNDDVVCDQVPLEEVKKMFQRTSSPRLDSVKFILQPYIFSETFIPEDVFGTKQILDIRIEYPLHSVMNRSLSLQVDADAFRSTKNYTTDFTINMIDCTLLDLGFLSGFDKLTKLMFANIYNIQECLSNLPLLSRLIKLHFEYCSGMNEFYHFPALTNGLRVFQFVNDNIAKSHSDLIINDETVDRIMDWLLLSSANTLEELAITYMKQVSRVPHKVASFKALTKLWLSDNNLSSIKSGELSFSAPVSVLHISDNGINEIEPGAFQGDFKDAEVFVYNNNLTRFEESVFGPILQQMASGRGYIGAAYEDGNPIDCSDGNICHLTWLKNYKADYDFWLKCSNGTSFKDLQPAGFNHCP